MKRTKAERFEGRQQMSPGDRDPYPRRVRLRAGRATHAVTPYRPNLVAPALTACQVRVYPGQGAAYDIQQAPTAPVTCPRCTTKLRETP